MLHYNEAKEIAIAEMNRDSVYAPMIAEEATVEKEYAWIFCYNSRQYIETGNIMHALSGNAPIFVSKYDGRVDCYRTGLSLEEMIDEHEERNLLWSLMQKADITYEAKQIQALKNILQWSMEVLAAFKKGTDACIAKGAKSRLLHLQKLLAEYGIDTNIQINKEAY